MKSPRPWPLTLSPSEWLYQIWRNSLKVPKIKAVSENITPHIVGYIMLLWKTVHAKKKKKKTCDTWTKSCASQHAQSVTCPCSNSLTQQPKGVANKWRYGNTQVVQMYQLSTCIQRETSQRTTRGCYETGERSPPQWGHIVHGLWLWISCLEQSFPFRLCTCHWKLICRQSEQEAEWAHLTLGGAGEGLFSGSSAGRQREFISPSSVNWEYERHTVEILYFAG